MVLVLLYILVFVFLFVAGGGLVYWARDHVGKKLRDRFPPPSTYLHDGLRRAPELWLSLEYSKAVAFERCAQINFGVSSKELRAALSPYGLTIALLNAWTNEIRNVVLLIGASIFCFAPWKPSSEFSNLEWIGLRLICSSLLFFVLFSRWLLAKVIGVRALALPGFSRLPLVFDLWRVQFKWKNQAALLVVTLPIVLMIVGFVILAGSKFLVLLHLASS